MDKVGNIVELYTYGSTNPRFKLLMQRNWNFKFREILPIFPWKFADFFLGGLRIFPRRFAEFSVKVINYFYFTFRWWCRCLTVCLVSGVPTRPWSCLVWRAPATPCRSSMLPHHHTWTCARRQDLSPLTLVNTKQATLNLKLSMIKRSVVMLSVIKQIWLSLACLS